MDYVWNKIFLSVRKRKVICVDFGKSQISVGALPRSQSNIFLNILVKDGVPTWSV